MCVVSSFPDSISLSVTSMFNVFRTLTAVSFKSPVITFTSTPALLIAKIDSATDSLTGSLIKIRPSKSISLKSVLSRFSLSKLFEHNASVRFPSFALLIDFSDHSFVFPLQNDNITSGAPTA